MQAVFEYLAHVLGVARGTLTKRMKQLAKKKEVWCSDIIVVFIEYLHKVRSAHLQPQRIQLLYTSLSPSLALMHMSVQVNICVSVY